MRYQSILLAVIFISSFRNVGATEPKQYEENIRRAVTRAIPLLEAGSAGSAEERTCFTCHNQALPILALSEAKRRGFSIDETNLKRQLEHTRAHLERGKKGYLEGKGQGGKSITAGYALWALQAGAHEPDETTSAVTSFLLQYQKDSDHWSHRGSRPPTSGSDFTTTSLVLQGLAAYGTTEQEPAIKSRIETVREWLVKSEPRDTEDKVFRLRALVAIESESDLRKQMAELLISQQREDGGWAQLSEMESDAYATGTVLAALLHADGALMEDERLKRGIEFLVNTQCEDGSWHVTTRAKPFQEYYESGFPHDEDQYISIAASSWATLALIQSLHESDD